MEKARIVIVEDEGLVALGIKDGLENMGYEVPAIAETGESALLRVRECKPDLILMDIRLKGQMDGIEAAEIIRKKYFVPVIFLTAHSDDGTLQRALGSESYGYIIKPFDERTLHAAIEIALYKARGERRLKDSNEWFSMVFQSIGEGVIICDLAGTVKFINTTACVMLNRNETECEGKIIDQILDVRDKEGRQKIEIDLSHLVSVNEIVENQDCLLYTRDNEILGIDLAVSPLINSVNSALGAIILLKAKKPLDKKEEAARRELSKPIEIQQSLLPENGRIVSGVKIQWLFLPSRFGSGDLFNLFRLDDEHVGFYILDVMGHGFSAAIFAITLHNMLLPYPHGGFLLARPSQSSVPYSTTRIPLDISEPSKVIEDLNKRFLFESNTSPFFTIVYGIIDTKKKKVKLARAGHMPPLIARANGELVRAELAGSAIGLFPNLVVEEKEYEINKGDRLFFHTDGLVDSRNNKMEEYSFLRLKGILEENIHKPTDQLFAKLEKSIKAWRDVEVFDDDIAFCALSLDEEYGIESL
jgi:serine phosphatase RsbU (regulator of sigma subunit)/DNA-binding response OmpR family regulator